jgi:carbamoylphosphate synthase large subunit
MFKIIVTSVGSLVGQNLLDVIDHRSDNIYVIGTTSLALIPLHRCKRVYLMPYTEPLPSAFTQRLLDIINREQPDLLIPSRDRDVTVLAGLAAEYPDLANRIPCGNLGTARILEDKWLSYLFARDHDLPFVRSAIPDSKSAHCDVYQLVNEVGFPLIAKPRMGYASRQVKLLSNTEQLKASLKDNDLVIQNYIGHVEILEALQNDIMQKGQPLFYSLEQPKYSVQTYIFRDGVVGPLCYTLHRMERGFSTRVELIVDKFLNKLGERWAEALSVAGWRGPLNMQCQRSDEGDFFAFELNGRFTGATAARYFLGHDELGYLLHDRLGQKLPGKKEIVDLQPIKYFRTIGVRQSDVEVLEKNHMWEE